MNGVSRDAGRASTGPVKKFLSDRPSGGEPIWSQPRIRYHKKMGRERALAAHKSPVAPRLLIDASAIYRSPKPAVAWVEDTIALQINELRSFNNCAELPFALTVCGLEAAPNIKSRLEGYSRGNWPDLQERDDDVDQVLKESPNRTIIWLSPDAKEAIRDIPANATLVMSCFVDKHCDQPNASLEEAAGHGIQAYRLPIAEIFHGGPKIVRRFGVHRPKRYSLALHCTFRALVEYYNTRNWRTALIRALPMGDLKRLNLMPHLTPEEKELMQRYNYRSLVYMRNHAERQEIGMREWKARKALEEAEVLD